MELNILRINYIGFIDNFSNVIKSIEWEYGDSSGTLELEKPSEDSFLDFEKINKEILKEWVNKKIDFKEIDEILLNSKRLLDTEKEELIFSKEIKEL